MKKIEGYLWMINSKKKGEVQKGKRVQKGEKARGIKGQTSKDIGKGGGSNKWGKVAKVNKFR